MDVGVLWHARRGGVSPPRGVGQSGAIHGKIHKIARPAYVIELIKYYIICGNVVHTICNTSPGAGVRGGRWRSAAGVR